MELTARTLSDRVDSFPDPWVPEAEDKLVGEIVELAVADKGYGPYDVITVSVTESSSTEQGGRAVPVGSVRVWHAFGTVPVNELKKLTPRVGDRIAVKYFGVRDGKDGPYKAYRIIVEPKAPSANGAVSDDVDVANLTEDKTQPRADAVSDHGHSDEERYADMLEIAARTAQVGPGGDIPYR